jgi:hypothetical protein
MKLAGELLGIVTSDVRGTLRPSEPPAPIVEAA